MYPLNLKRTNAKNPDFVYLVKYLDAELAIADGDDHAFYSQYNKIDTIRHVVLAYDHQKVAGCGALKEFSPGVAEIKRMYVNPETRGKGIASIILKELENWARELAFTKCILETGKRQPDAIQLYKKNGYALIPNYGQYKGVENSFCFEKILTES